MSQSFGSPQWPESYKMIAQVHAFAGPVIKVVLTVMVPLTVPNPLPLRPPLSPRRTLKYCLNVAESHQWMAG